MIAPNGQERPSAYGLTILGVETPLLQPDAAETHSLRVRQGHGQDPPRDGDERLTLRDGTTVRIRAGLSSEVTFSGARPLSDDALVHPYLAPVISVLAAHHGRDAYHAGAVAGRAGAWAVVGARNAGKSTLLTHLASRGATVLTDDLLVVDDEEAVRGPRCVDLRGPSAAELGLGRPLGRVGERERWRVDLPPAVRAAPLRGFVFLEWGDTLSLRPMPVSSRLALLGTQRMTQLHGLRPEQLLQRCSLPTYVLRRPRSWDSLDPSAEELLQLVG